MTQSWKLAGILVSALALAGCGEGGLFAQRPDVTEPAADADAVAVVGPDAVGQLPIGRPDDAAQPAAVGIAPGSELGRTIASLGDPTAPGQWLRTGLVQQVMPGRVLHPASGASISVELRPTGREPGSGSQLSMAGFQALGLSLTDLPELVVFAE